MKILSPENKQNYKYLLCLLSSVISNTQPPKPNANTDWASVFLLAERHSVAGMTAYAVLKLSNEDLPDKDVLDKFIEAQRSELILESNIQFETDKLLKALKDKEINVMLLKGIVLKSYYPVSSMRSMSDVDLLYKISDKDAIISLFESDDYKLTLDFHDELNFTKPPFYHYELHSTLVSPNHYAYDYYKNIWDKAVTREDGFAGLSLDDTYIYMLEHIAKHIEKSGAGIRMLIDVFLFRRKEASKLNAEYIKAELSKLRLADFEQKIIALTESWFGSDNPDTESIAAQYILSSSTFGTVRNAILQTNIRKEHKTGKKQNGLKYIVSKLFPTPKHLRGRFPKGRCMGIFYPFYLVAYWCLRLFKDKNVKTKNISHYFAKTDSHEAKTIISVIEDLGLSERL